MSLTYCDFVTENNECFCKKCKKPYHKQICPERIIRQCTVQEEMSLKARALNFTAAMIEYYKSGCEKVSKEVYEDRLKICSDCGHRKGNRCAVCGCRLQGNAIVVGKAMLPSETCPIGRWPLISKE